MINSRYIFAELLTRKGRTFTNTLLTATATAIIIFSGLATGALQKAFQAPLADLGATMTIQLSGDVPEKMNGPVLPCSVAPINEIQIQQITTLNGIQSTSPAILFWDFQDDAFQVVTGFDPLDQSGPALLQQTMVSGRRLTGGHHQQALADLTWATDQGIKVGNTVKIADRDFEIIGLVDSSRLSQIARAQFYISLTTARDIASKSTGINKIHTFGANDANILFIRADRDKTEDLTISVKMILGKNSLIATPQSFQKLLGSMFTLTQRFASLIAALAVIIALVLISRTTASGIRERSGDITILKTIGWTNSEIGRQLAAESLVLISTGTAAGIIIGLSGGWLLSLFSIAIPIPWDMAPTPHFLAGGDAQLTRAVQLSLPPAFKLIMLATVSALIIGLTTTIISSRAIGRLKPSEVLRNG